MIRNYLTLFLLLCTLADATAQGLSPLTIFSGPPGTDSEGRLLLAPDGLHLFSVGIDAQGVILASFDVEESTGDLAFVDSERPEDCEFITDLELSSDGSLLFYNCFFFGIEAIGAIRVDLNTGELLLINNRLIQVNGNNQMRGMAISPDNQNLYVTGFIADNQPGDPGGFVNAYELEPVDGELVQTQAIGQAELEGGAVRDLFLSPDGRHVYTRVINGFAVNLLLFDRNANGQLTNSRVVPLGPSIGDPVFTSNGTRLYATASQFSEPASIPFLIYIERDTNNGELTRIQGNTDFSLNSSSLASAADGRLLYNATDGIRAYRINPSSGAYTLVAEDLNAGFADLGQFGFSSIAISPDEQHLYAAFDSGIALFEIDGVAIPPAAEVPAFNLAGLTAMILLILAGAAITYRRSLNSSG